MSGNIKERKEGIFFFRGFLLETCPLKMCSSKMVDSEKEEVKRICMPAWQQWDLWDGLWPSVHPEVWWAWPAKIWYQRNGPGQVFLPFLPPIQKDGVDVWSLCNCSSINSGRRWLGGKNEALWTTGCLFLAVHSEQVDDSAYAATVHMCFVSKSHSGLLLERQFR